MTIEPKGVARPVTIYEVGGLGGNYKLALPQRDVHWTDVRPALPLTFRWLTEKEVVGEAHEGWLVRFSEHRAEIKSQTLPPKFTDLKLLFKSPDFTLLTAGVYGKVVAQSTKDGSFVLHFTAFPPEARQYFIDLEPVASPM
jgi:adenylate cyclase